MTTDAAEPIPVTVANSVPIAVMVTAPGRVGDLPATTTAEQDRRTAGQREQLALRAVGQRRVNIIWEGTQALMAISLTAAEIYCAVNDINAKALDVAFGAVVTMYFIRTNHTKTGGVGGGEVESQR